MRYEDEISFNFSRGKFQRQNTNYTLTIQIHSYAQQCDSSMILLRTIWNWCWKRILVPPAVLDVLSPHKNVEMLRINSGWANNWCKVFFRQVDDEVKTFPFRIQIKNVPNQFSNLKTFEMNSRPFIENKAENFAKENYARQWQRSISEL